MLIVNDILNLCNGKLICGDKYLKLKKLSSDTRKLKRNSCFLGIKGNKYNGSIFYKEALKKGAKVCILQDIKIDDKVLKKYKNRTIILVDDVLKTIELLAEYKRSLFNGIVIAVTGSNGKTSTKDIISSVLSKKYKVLKTKGNLNNNIGLPLTILELKKEDILVLEMGMNHKNEIEFLSKIAKPNIAVITNIGTSHIGNLGSKENILKAKLEVLKYISKNGILIINNDDDLLYKWNNNKNNSEYNVLSYGIENISDLNAFDVKLNQNYSAYTIYYKKKKETVKINIGSNNFIYNSLSAICIGRLLGVSESKIISGIRNFKVSNNRMNMIKNSDITIIDDTYNASYESMKSSIEYLSIIEGKRKIAVLGDMLELGKYSKKLHQDLTKEIIENKIDILITVGKYSKYIANKNIEYYCFNNNKDAIDKINSIKNNGDVILVKASNSMNFKEIVSSIK